MTFLSRSLRWGRLGLLVALLLAPVLAVAAGRQNADRQNKAPKFGQFNPQHDTVEMFAATRKGQIDVKLIPKDSTQSRLLIENKTNKPLNVKLPEAFAGVPVLAQIGGQGVGGGGGMFNVPPEKVGKLDVMTVCLEHGKREPRPSMKYEIKPIESFTDKVEVHELCRMLGTGRISQRAAQVAAWHLTGDMSFQQLAAKRIRHANGISRPYFSGQEIEAGMQLAAMAARLAEQRKKTGGP